MYYYMSDLILKYLCSYVSPNITTSFFIPIKNLAITMIWTPNDRKNPP